MSPDRCPELRVLSYGGGTQSAALALMSAAGQLPRLDAVVFADTEGELPETYSYAEYVQGHLDRAGIPFVRVSAGSLEDALLSPVRTTSNPTPPAHVLNPDGSAGKVLGYRCSYDFKRRIVTREVKRLANERGGGRGAWKRMRVEQWLGFSVDEIARCKESTECRCGHSRLRVPRRGSDGTEVVGGHRPECDRCGCTGFRPVAGQRVATHQGLRPFISPQRHDPLVRRQRAPDTTQKRVLVLPQLAQHPVGGIERPAS